MNTTRAGHDCPSQQEAHKRGVLRCPPRLGALVVLLMPGRGGVGLLEEMMKCFYHNADLDGKCSAAIVLSAFPDCELIGINYGDPFPWDTIDRGYTGKGIERELVYMVDFSLQPFGDMLRLNALAELVWIDHHKTAIEDADRHLTRGFNPVGPRRVGIGACALVWEAIWPDKPLPDGVRLLAEYDVWDHSDEACLPFQYGMRNFNTDPASPIWTDIFDGMTQYFIETGQTILDYESKQNAIKAHSLSFATELDGLKCIAANQGLTNSKLFDSVWDPEKYDAMLCFSWRKGKWTVSLYTDKDGIDVGAVAKARGGGGHVGAAGFQCAELPFVLA